jgi:putative ABC transport system ATP-binding protein
MRVYCLAMIEPILEFAGVTKAYVLPSGPARRALCDVSFTVRPGTVVSIVGRSGSGKTTLLNLAAGIDLPSQGRIRVAGRDLAELGDRARALLRRHQIGLIFQFFHLLPHLSVAENVALPAWIAGQRNGRLRQRVRELLARVELAERAGDPIHQLSGGEMQRVAICRAMLPGPRLLLADEPTGSLDDTSGRRVMDLLLRLARQERGTLIYVTHSTELAGLADEIWHLHSGILERP